MLRQRTARLLTPSSDARDVAQAWQRTYAGQVDAQPGATKAILPLLPQHLTRGASDARAAWQRWHAEAWIDPQDADISVWQQVLARARAETLASRHLPGMAGNLNDLASIAPPGTAFACVYRASRIILAGSDTPTPVLPDFPSQNQVASQSRGLLARIGARLSRPASSPKASPSPVPSMTEAQARDLLIQARSVLADEGRYLTLLRPLVLWLAAQQAACSTAACSTAATSPSGVLQKTETRKDAPSAEEEDRDAHETLDGAGSVVTAPRLGAGYAIFSTRWDETLPAAHFLPSRDTHALNTLNGPERAQVRKLAHRLQRRLMSARMRSWSFDQTDGQLDSRRLARLLTPGQGNAVFRQESESPIPEACVTLLVDQSGSMDRKRRQMAALAIDLAVHTLESCRVSCEVLGYTTRYGANSPVVEAWRRTGSPAEPGRLNAIRHLIYKTAAQPWRRCRPALGLLLHESFGRENIDGEALDWAARRLAARPEPRKILVVLSDGAPYDAGTCLAHDRLYLEGHLRRVIAAIAASPIHLAGLGSGNDVGRFYQHALTLRRPEEVAGILFEHLGELLTRPSPARISS